MLILTSFSHRASSPMPLLMFVITARFRAMLWPLALTLLMVSSLQRPSMAAKLKVGFYSKSCPRAEVIVRSVVKEATKSDPAMPAALLRLHFHDCVVKGCDGSVLIQKPAEEGPENRSPHHMGLRGFDVIERAKAKLEAKCKGVVSCADIVALAARDSVYLSHGPLYHVPTGRRDGRVSNISHAANMPEVHDSVAALKSKFSRKGLSEKDLVLLSAAHTIGTTACFFVEERLYSFNSSDGTDPLISRRILPELMARCPRGGDVVARLPLDLGSERKFDARILRNIQTGRAVIESDAKLYADASTRAIVDRYGGVGGGRRVPAKKRPSFRADFARSMVKLGRIGVKTGKAGEIRRICSSFN